MYNYKQEGNVYTLSEYDYKSKTFFRIIFKIGKIKAKTEKLEFNPLIGYETIPEWEYKKLFDKMLYKYQWI